MATNNGTTVETTTNRVEGKVGETEVTTKGKPKDKFDEAFNFLRDCEGGKPKTAITRKTEKGKMSASLAGMPKSLTVKAVTDLAAEVGLKAQVKSDAGVGAAEASSSRSLTDENAEKFVKIICAE